MTRRLQITILFLLFVGSLSCFEKGSTVKIELQNGSVLIGKVIRTSEKKAWIKTRYGIFQVKLQTVKKKTVIKTPITTKPPQLKKITPKKNKSKIIKLISLQSGLLPPFGTTGSELNTGFSISSSFLIGTDRIMPFITIGFSKYSADSQSGSLTLINTEGGCRFYLYNNSRQALYIGASIGAVYANAQLDTNNITAEGIRFSSAVYFGCTLPLSGSIFIKIQAGWKMILETDATLYSCPVITGFEFKL